LTEGLKNDEGLRGVILSRMPMLGDSVGGKRGDKLCQFAWKKEERSLVKNVLR